LNRRPNLGLFGPETASHLREKGVWDFPTLKPPILLIEVKIKKNLTGNSFYVKSEFSIIKLTIIEKSNSNLAILFPTIFPKIDIEKDKPQKLPSPRFRVATTGGRRIKKVIMHPHPSPLPCLRRSGFAQAGIKGEGELDRVNLFFLDILVSFLI
jgi:hypothetical protein